MSTLGEKKTNRRVLRTKRNIRNAFLRLLAQKEMDKITIKEIAAEADVDRKTVYNYYTSVQGILEELENELVQNFEKALSKMNFGSMEKGMMAFHTLTELIEENLEVYGLLMKLDGHSRLMSKIKIYLKEKARDNIRVCVSARSADDARNIAQGKRAIKCTIFSFGGSLYQRMSYYTNKNAE